MSGRSLVDLEQRAAGVLEIYQRTAAKMYILDSHDGRKSLRGSGLTGRTAQAAARLEQIETPLWARFDALRRLTERIPAADGYHGLEVPEREAIAALLDDDVVDLDAQGLPVTLASPRHHATTARLHDFAAQVETECERAVRLCTEAETAFGSICETIADIDRWSAQLDAHVAAVGMAGHADLLALRQRRQREVTAALRDPLHAVSDDALRPLATEFARIAQQVATLVGLRENYPRRLSALRTAVAALADLERDCTLRCQRARAAVAAPAVPLPPSVADALTVAVHSAADLAAEGSWHTMEDQLRHLNRRTAEAAKQCCRCAETATALLDRRIELRGRFLAYSRKAARLGVVEEPVVERELHATRAALRSTPCDLPAITVALHRFQQAIRTVQGDQRR
jgi:hypothetical protein